MGLVPSGLTEAEAEDRGIDSTVKNRWTQVCAEKAKRCPRCLSIWESYNFEDPQYSESNLRESVQKQNWGRCEHEATFRQLLNIRFHKSRYPHVETHAARRASEIWVRL